MKCFPIILIMSSSALAAKPKLTLLSEGLKRPVDLAAAPGNDDLLYVLEQNGPIHAISRESGEKKHLVLNLTGKVSRGHNEEGLLGIAFSPKFEQDRRFYLYYTTGDNGNRSAQISRFVMGSDGKADPAKEEKLLNFKQDFGNHNGGWIAFGPDGMLYLGVGDGGRANDPKRRAQDLGNLLGSLLRIDVSGEKSYTVPTDNPFVKKEGAKPEIYAYGLRNPWRCAFDGETGDLWIADVGQNHWEEVNFVPPSALKGANFGWRPREGTRKTPKRGIGGEVPGAYEPIYEYNHKMNEPTGGLSITGGYLYRGSNEDLKGQYLFADYVAQRIWGIEQEGGKMKKFHDHTETLITGDQVSIGPISSFGQDNQKEVYVVDHSGKIFRID